MKIVILSVSLPLPAGCGFVCNFGDTVKVLNIERAFFAGGCLNVGIISSHSSDLSVLFHYPFFLLAHLPLPHLASASAL